MTNEQIEKLCKEKEQELLKEHFGNLVIEAAIDRPETIGKYVRDLPLKIAIDYCAYLKELWVKEVPEGMNGAPFVLEERMLRKLKTRDDREMVDYAYEDAVERTLWERITQSNHKDVTFYKGLLEEYTIDVLMVMRHDFLEEITGKYIKNKAFEDD